MKLHLEKHAISLALNTQKSQQESRDSALWRLMLQGKVSKALKFLDNNSAIKGVHQVTDEIK